MAPSPFVTKTDPWRRDLFHGEMARRMELDQGTTVVDLGCGKGASCKALLARYGWVIGLDTDAEALEAARAALPTDRLQLEKIEPGKPLPLRNGEADGLLMQNVLEYVEDQPALITEAARVVRSGGILLIGHFDFDAVILASGRRDLTRRLLHAFSDNSFPGQSRADGQAGREIPGLMRQFEWARLELGTVVYSEYELHPDGYAVMMLDWLADSGRRMGVSDDELADWRGELDQRAAEGRFHFVLPWVYAKATKASAGDSGYY